MNLQCPVCGGELFYLQEHGSFVSFRIGPEGHAVDIRATKELVDLTPETVVHCLTCVWHGAVLELLAGA